MKAVLILAIVLQDFVARIFKAHPKIDEIYMTSDGQGFTDEHKAESHAAYLKDKKVQHFTRKAPKASKPKKEKDKAPENPEDEPEEDIDAPLKKVGDDPESDAVELDREALMKEYEELLGKKAPNNIKTETLVERIQEATAK